MSEEITHNLLARSPNGVMQRRTSVLTSSIDVGPAKYQRLYFVQASADTSDVEWLISEYAACLYGPKVNTCKLRKVLFAIPCEHLHDGQRAHRDLVVSTW